MACLLLPSLLFRIKMADVGLYGLAVMGQNFALNMASKGFSVSVCNRSHDKVRLQGGMYPIGEAVAVLGHGGLWY